jgi:hypothetical protein
MKKLIKFITVIIFSVFILQNSLLADDDDTDGYVHPAGLDNAKVKSKDGRQTTDMNQWWLNEENLSKYTNIEKWMNEEGLKFNGENLTKITNGIHRCLNKMWRDALQSLLACETLKNHRGGKTYKELLDGINDNNKQKDILFNPYVSSDADAQVDKSGNNIELPIQDLEGIVRYYAKKINSGNFDISDFNDPNGDKSSKHFFSQTGYIGHEMLHAFTGLSAAI